MATISELISETITDPSKRQEFVLLFDVRNGNPNGDPDAANAPRVDPETGHGLVTDVALKRKVRDYLALTRKLPMFIQSVVALNRLKSEAADEIQPPLSKEEREGKRPIQRLQDKLCADYYDIRMFGAVLATGEAGDRLNAGQVRGPVQLTFARSVDPILPLDAAITRQARTTEERMETGTTEFGRKPFVPYGLYRAHGYVNPFLAERTGVDSSDLRALWEALASLFAFDQSASRSEMAVRGLYVFTHDNQLGMAPAHTLLERIEPRRKPEVATPRAFTDYKITVRDDDFPSGVTLTPLVG
jgi:CRISPR-associated protein Csd2